MPMPRSLFIKSEHGLLIEFSSYQTTPILLRIQEFNQMNPKVIAAFRVFNPITRR